MISFELGNNNAVSETLRDEAKRAFVKVLANQTVGFHQLDNRSQLWSTCERRAQELKDYDTLAVIGIGGSSLGTRAIYSALASQNQKKLLFFEAPDLISIERKISSIQNLQKVHWVIISKSGSTLETLSVATFIYELLAEKKIDFTKSTTVISELKKNPLSDWAKNNHVPVLEIPEDVGGRFSVLTAVGVLPAAFLGMNVQQMREEQVGRRNKKI